MGDGFYRSKDLTNSIKLLKVHIVHREIKHTKIGTAAAVPPLETSFQPRYQPKKVAN